jgi:hypothetical protein
VNVRAMHRWRFGGVGVLACAWLSMGNASAPRSATITTADSGLADIQAVYAWMDSDGLKINLAMTVSPFDPGTTSFKPGIQYAFHAQALRTPAASDGVLTQIICEFGSATEIQCWVGRDGTTDEYLSGNPASTTGLVNSGGSIRVFAGRRSDPFFFNSAGFSAAMTLARGAAAGAPRNAAGCPAITPTSAAAIVQQFSRRPPPNQAQPGEDRFSNTNVLALLVRIDKRLIKATASAPILTVWGSTHTK